MGNATTGRNQYLESKNNLKKIFQEATLLTAPDINEQSDIILNRMSRILYDVVKQGSVRFGTGWALSGGSNSITIAAGDCAIRVPGQGRTYLLYLSGNTAVTGWTTPNTGDRIDVLYLDLHFKIIDSADEAGLIDPNYGTENAVDYRLTWTYGLQQGTVGGGVPSLPSPPTDHYYVAIANIARTNGVATINFVDITNLLVPWQPQSEIMLYSETHTVAMGVNTNVAAGFATGTDVYAVTQEATPAFYSKFRGACFKSAKFNKIKARFYARGQTTGTCRFTVNGFTAVEMVRSDNTTNTYHEITINVETAADNADLNWNFEIKSQLSFELQISRFQVVAVCE